MEPHNNEVQQLLWGDLSQNETGDIIQITKFLMRRTFLQDYVFGIMLLKDTNLLTETVEDQLDRISVYVDEDEHEAVMTVIPVDQEVALEKTIARLLIKIGATFMMRPTSTIDVRAGEIGRITLMGIYLQGMIEHTHGKAMTTPCFQTLQNVVGNAMKWGKWYGGTRPQLWVNWMNSLAAYEYQEIDWAMIPIVINEQQVPIESVWDLFLAIVVLSPSLVPLLKSQIDKDTLNMERVDQLITLFRFSVVESGMTMRKYVLDILGILYAWFPENENLDIDLDKDPLVFRKTDCSVDDLIEGECYE